MGGTGADAVASTGLKRCAHRKRLSTLISLMRSNNPRVSIGLPVYNGERFLKEALDSLLAQTYADFELTISDNASTDQTESICHAYEASDRRIRYYRNKENAGAAYNFNRVFELSHGEYFKWATADDVCSPELVARCLSVLDTTPTAVLVCAKTGFIDETGTLVDRYDPGWDLRDDSAHERLRYIIYAGHLVNPYYGLVRTSALSKTQLIRNYSGGDYCVLGELSLLGKFFEIPECLFFRRFYSDASSQHSDDLEWQARFYNGKTKLTLPCLYRSVGHFTTIVHSQLHIGQKLSLIGSLLHSLLWRRRRLYKELRFALKNIKLIW